MALNLAIITAHAGASCLEEAVASWKGANNQPYVHVADGYGGMLKGYQEGFELVKNYDILAFLHDDCIIKEPNWVDRVLREFESPDVGLVGFGGALVHGSPDLYKTPYHYQQLGRSYYLSNVDDAEVHGARFTGSNDVAVLDGFSLIVRRDVLDRAGGWPVATLGYLGYDYWASCMVHRLGYRCRVVGARCHHLGGRTAVALKKNQDESGEA